MVVTYRCEQSLCDDVKETLSKTCTLRIQLLFSASLTQKELIIETAENKYIST